MIEGMGWLLGLCPPPEELVLADLCKPFGILPSQVQTQDDWKFLAANSSLRNLEANYAKWNQVVGQEEGGTLSMDQDLIQYMLDLVSKAKERYGR